MLICYSFLIIFLRRIGYGGGPTLVMSPSTVPVKWHKLHDLQ